MMWECGDAALVLSLALSSVWPCQKTSCLILPLPPCLIGTVMFDKDSIQDDIDEISVEINSLKCSDDCLDESDNMCDVLANLENIMSESDRIGNMAEALWKKLSKPVKENVG